MKEENNRQTSSSGVITGVGGGVDAEPEVSRTVNGDVSGFNTTDGFLTRTDFEVEGASEKAVDDGNPPLAHRFINK